MKKRIIPISLFFSICAYSQIGINTETPKATLDITATGSLTTPDGIRTYARIPLFQRD